MVIPTDRVRELKSYLKRLRRLARCNDCKHSTSGYCFFYSRHCELCVNCAELIKTKDKPKTEIGGLDELLEM